MSIVRDNLLNRKNYTPYCGKGAPCYMPRSFFNGEQFECHSCKWQSGFEPEFIDKYKAAQKQLKSQN